MCNSSSFDFQQLISVSNTVYLYVNHPCTISCNSSCPHACLRCLPRCFFTCVWPVARTPAAACLRAFHGLLCPFPSFCLRCARSRASNLFITALAFPISYLGTNVVFHCTQ